jgi:hypothetical protein
MVMGWAAMLRALLIVAASQIAVWLVFIAFVFVIRPDGSSLRDAA